ncbi:HAD family hydrolase [Saccharopolyspora phatthalungensis]|uniref:Putative hydrolase of the HAD superfamily n=1 Tax=Saccharopolyspora phatthalungensis TaxID=664693 RepID=A0A840Q4L5_9PSEU|nr:HAD family hydrolase [Saccharopolyspora phatthalungensis]MBB5155416.1 putative hydrolase of the HAD superfamily [Saccharopolyspora phatthalungensis]
MTSAPETSTTHELGQIKAVCLDVDDTLLNSERASRHGLRELVGSDRAWPVWQRTTDRHYARFVTNEIDFDAMCIERTQAFFAAFGEELDPAEAARRETLRMAAMQQAWGLYDDALPCLDWLRASGLQLAVITNAPSAYQRKKIGAVGLADTFDTLIISDEIGVAKPDERIFHTACDALGLDPEEVVHVGDKLDTDALGATRAGLHGVWLNRDEARAPAAHVPTITSLYELPELLVTDLPAIPARGQATRHRATELVRQ